MRATTVLFVLGLIAGCAMERAARLYPENDAAASNGVVQARFVAHGTGNGAVEITMPDGELVKGEYSIVRQGSIEFGSIFGSVYGPRRSATGTAFTSTETMQRGSQGTASAFGSKGTRMSCEFLNDNASGHGYGACRSSAGALYRLQY